MAGSAGIMGGDQCGVTGVREQKTVRLLGYRSVLHEAAGALGSGWEHTQICILRERSDRLAASEASLAVACERSEASVTAIVHIWVYIKCIIIMIMRCHLYLTSSLASMRAAVTRWLVHDCP